MESALLWPSSFARITLTSASVSGTVRGAQLNYRDHCAALIFVPVAESAGAVVSLGAERTGPPLRRSYDYLNVKTYNNISLAF